MCHGFAALSVGCFRPRLWETVTNSNRLIRLNIIQQNVALMSLIDNHFYLTDIIHGRIIITRYSYWDARLTCFQEMPVGLYSSAALLIVIIVLQYALLHVLLQNMLLYKLLSSVIFMLYQVFFTISFHISDITHSGKNVSINARMCLFHRADTIPPDAPTLTSVMTLVYWFTPLTG